jgi:nucleoid-associated protein EbfC
MSFNWEAIQKASKDLEANMKKAHQDLNAREFTGEAGAGMVTATMLGNYRIKAIEVAESVFNEFNDKQKLATLVGDLCAAACNDAANKIEEYSKSTMQSMATNFDLGNLGKNEPSTEDK